MPWAVQGSAKQEKREMTENLGQEVTFKVQLEVETLRIKDLKARQDAWLFYEKGV